MEPAFAQGLQVVFGYLPLIDLAANVAFISDLWRELALEEVNRRFDALQGNSLVLEAVEIPDRFMETISLVNNIHQFGQVIFENRSDPFLSITLLGNGPEHDDLIVKEVRINSIEMAPSVILMLANRVENLTEFTLESNVRFDNEDLAELMMNNNLKELSINNCPNITAGGLRSVVAYESHLKVLRITFPHSGRRELSHFLLVFGDHPVCRIRCPRSRFTPRLKVKLTFGNVRRNLYY